MGQEIEFMIANKNDKNSWQPVLMPHNQLDVLIKEHPEISIIDEMHRNLEELFLLRNPKYRFDKNYNDELNKFLSCYDKNFGNWFYFPWSNTLIRYLPEGLHYELRTGRNKYLINDKEQAKFYNATIVFLGMSVGSHIAIVTVMTGGAKKMKLVDPDTISGDNLNRIRSGFGDVGVKKAIIVARQIFEINPYTDVELYLEGLNEENAEKIINGVDVVIEEMDNLYWKIKAREIARQKSISVLMGTDNGDGVIIDIERYDVNKNLPILNGYAESITSEILKTIIPNDIPKMAGKIAGANLTVPRMLYSVSEVGKSLYSWPQLGTAANMCGSIISMLIRRIVNKDKNIKSGRYSINPDSIFESDYNKKWFSRKIGFFRFVKKVTENS